MSQSEGRKTRWLSTISRENIFQHASRAPRRHFGGWIVLFVAFVLVFQHAALRAQSDKDKGKPSDTSRVRIEVTGGDENKPVPDASVYLKFVEDRKLLKDRTIEFNLKTNQEGIALSPEVPKGKILIQIAVPGWKTYGEYFELNQDEQTIQVHLVRPSTKWY